MSQVWNSMETKLGQSVQLSEVINKTELLQWDVGSQRSCPTKLPMSMVHARMAQFSCVSQLSSADLLWHFKATYLRLSAQKQSCMNEQKKICNTSEHGDICFKAVLNIWIFDWWFKYSNKKSAACTENKFFVENRIFDQNQQHPNIRLPNYSKMHSPNMFYDIIMDEKKIHIAQA